MTPTEWPQVEPMPSIDPPTDLFAGDILGDELIDIYHAAVVSGGDHEAMNEIPTLHPGAIVVAAGSSIDDGLGAFRPSTSFNDLTTLLPQGNVPTAIVSAQAKPAETKKRAASAAHAGAPAAKRKANNGRKTTSPSLVSKSKAKGSSSKASKAQLVDKKKAKKEDDTPNPLTYAPQQVSSGVKVDSLKPAAKVTVGASSPAVVTPHVQLKPTESAPSVAATGLASTAVTAPPTEADFKSVAQAAVSNLIMNAGSTGKAETTSAASVGSSSVKIDTSTEHIKALTGSNWVAVCSGGDVGQSACSATDKMNNRARRQNLTPDERARQNRDRNREHARNTRLRKKAYVEELKRTLTALVSQRDAAELEKRHSAQRELEQREVRFRVIEEFLKLRGRNEVNFARWAAILEENFVLTLPAYEHLGFSSSENARNVHEQVFSGVSEAMAESNMFSSFLQSLGKNQEKTEITFVYNCDRKNFFMDNCIAVLDWNASTHGAVQKGAPAEITLKGTLKAKFSPASNKLISVSMIFDAGIVLSQLNTGLKSNDLSNDEVDAVAAAQVAANQADALLDSLQVPHINPASVPSNVTIGPATGTANANGPAAITDAEKSDSSDESNPDSDDSAKGMTTRRGLRRKE